MPPDIEIEVRPDVAGAMMQRVAAMANRGIELNQVDTCYATGAGGQHCNRE